MNYLRKREFQENYENILEFLILDLKIKNEEVLKCHLMFENKPRMENS